MPWRAATTASGGRWDVNGMSAVVIACLHTWQAQPPARHCCGSAAAQRDCPRAVKRRRQAASKRQPPGDPPASATADAVISPTAAFPTRLMPESLSRLRTARGSGRGAAAAASSSSAEGSASASASTSGWCVGLSLDRAQAQPIRPGTPGAHAWLPDSLAGRVHVASRPPRFCCPSAATACLRRRGRQHGQQQDPGPAAQVPGAAVSHAGVSRGAEQLGQQAGAVPRASHHQVCQDDEPHHSLAQGVEGLEEGKGERQREAVGQGGRDPAAAARPRGRGKGSSECRVRGWLSSMNVVRSSQAAAPSCNATRLGRRHRAPAPLPKAAVHEVVVGVGAAPVALPLQSSRRGRGEAVHRSCEAAASEGGESVRGRAGALRRWQGSMAALAGCPPAARSPAHLDRMWLARIPSRAWTAIAARATPTPSFSTASGIATVLAPMPELTRLASTRADCPACWPAAPASPRPRPRGPPSRGSLPWCWPGSRASLRLAGGILGEKQEELRAARGEGS